MSERRPPEDRTPRRLIVRDIFGEQVGPDGHDEIDLTGLINVNTAAQPVVVMQTRCNLGHWHDRYTVNLPCWPYDGGAA